MGVLVEVKAEYGQRGEAGRPMVQERITDVRFALCGSGLEASVGVNRRYKNHRNKDMWRGTFESGTLPYNMPGMLEFARELLRKVEETYATKEVDNG